MGLLDAYKDFSSKHIRSNILVTGTLYQHSLPQSAKGAFDAWLLDKTESFHDYWYLLIRTLPSDEGDIFGNNLYEFYSLEGIFNETDYVLEVSFSGFSLVKSYESTLSNPPITIDNIIKAAEYLRFCELILSKLNNYLDSLDFEADTRKALQEVETKNEEQKAVQQAKELVEKFGYVIAKVV